MIERLRITVLADNYVAAPSVLGEHGLSLFIEADGRRILFDTGQGKGLVGNADALGANALHNRIVWTESVSEVVPGVWCTGEIPRLPANGPTESGFFLDRDCQELDPLADDQALYIETKAGLVVIAGCAHAGIANTLDRVAQLTGQEEFFGLVGGLHLWRSTRQELEVSGNAIGRRKFQIIAPCHCTGLGAHSYLRTRFNSLVQEVGAGTRLHFGD